MTTRYTTDPWISSTPAAVDRSTGILYINPRLFSQLTPFQKKFVKLHEEGHWRLNTDSETRADAYAFRRLAGTELRSLKQAMDCIDTLLSDNNPTKARRYRALYRLALAYDWQHTSNPRAAAELAALGPQTATSGQNLSMWKSQSTQQQAQILQNNTENLSAMLDSFSMSNSLQMDKMQTLLTALIALVALWFVYKNFIS